MKLCQPSDEATSNAENYASDAEQYLSTGGSTGAILGCRSPAARVQEKAQDRLKALENPA